ncbi:energy-coupling factor ABC transporter ATP-binding protein [Sodalis ligni]|uniref:Cobalt/nickel transport system ATP-binding protein n=1 Tax=Sodalis ligni TaxID=2697027 RepID=A0A4R1NA93_9GAMM|nr:ATP-binding cassette domain-containing protein [Sodalis ligni]TCL04202.1 cobalt/nickel transport system ATP-binding protein [Sodalis ligni]
MDIIKLSDVSFSYDGKHNALNHLDLTVGQGERVAVLGPNGAGKSTLFQLFNGLLLPQGGRVVVDSLPVVRENFIELRRRVGMVFQDSDDQLFNATVYREVAYGLVNMKIAGEELDNTVRWALNIVGMESYIHRNPFNLSGGEKKRIALASVIAMKPKVLVLDEPFNALDPRSASHLVHMLNDINKTLGITLIFTLHDMDIVPLLADKVYLMDKGEVVLGGNLSEFFNQKDILRRFELRLPRVAHLAELLMRDGRLDEKGLPLTIGQAKEMIEAALAPKS